jgi:hypothetical protein
MIVMIQSRVVKYNTAAGTNKWYHPALQKNEMRKGKKKTPSLKTKRGISWQNRMGFWMQRDRPKDASREPTITSQSRRLHQHNKKRNNVEERCGKGHKGVKEDPPCNATGK